MKTKSEEQNITNVIQKQKQKQKMGMDCHCFIQITYFWYTLLWANHHLGVIDQVPSQDVLSGL